MRKSVTHAAIAVLGAALVAAACAGTSRRAPSLFQQKLIILGFDGMDPHLLDKWIAEGKLPNIAKLAKQAGRALSSSMSQESSN